MSDVIIGDVRLRSERGIITEPLTYDSPALDAILFPHLFPDGYGSFKPRSAIRIPLYSSLLLESVDNRFRDDTAYSFFLSDRKIKMQLLGYAHSEGCKSAKMVLKKCVTDYIASHCL